MCNTEIRLISRSLFPLVGRPVVGGGGGGSGGSLEPPVEGSVRCACAHPKVQGTHRNTRGVWQGERGVLTGQRQQLRLLKTPQLIARPVASGPVGPVFTGPPLFSEHALHARGLASRSHAFSGKRGSRRVLIAPRRGAHFKKCLRTYLRRPEIKKNSWGGMPPDPTSWRAYARIKYITRSSTSKLNVLSTALCNPQIIKLPTGLVGARAHARLPYINTV